MLNEGKTRKHFNNCSKQQTIGKLWTSIAQGVAPGINRIWWTEITTRLQGMVWPLAASKMSYVSVSDGISTHHNFQFFNLFGNDMQIRIWKWCDDTWRSTRSWVALCLFKFNEPVLVVEQVQSCGDCLFVGIRHDRHWQTSFPGIRSMS